KGTNTIELKNVPSDMGQRYILFVDAENHRSHSVFPVRVEPGADTPVNIMLIRNNPVPDFTEFSYEELKIRSPNFHAAISENITESTFLGLAKSDPKFGMARMASLLNIEAKLRATPLKEGQAVEYVRRFADLSSLEPDRIKVSVASNMPTNVRGLKTF